MCGIEDNPDAINRIPGTIRQVRHREQAACAAQRGEGLQDRGGQGAEMAQAGSLGVQVGRDGAAMGAIQRIEFEAGARFHVALDLPAGPPGDVLVAFVRGEGPAAIGVCGLMACRADDHPARIAYLESSLLG